MAAVCLAAVVARCLGFRPPIPLWEQAYEGVELLAVVMCGLRAWNTAGGERAAWALFGLGLLAFTSADLYYTLVLMDAAEVPYPSLADAGYLAFYPAAYAGLVLLLRAHAPRLSSALWLDGVVCALAGAAVGAALVLTVVADDEGSFATVATNIAYPLADVILLGFVIAVLLIAGRSAGATWRLLGLAFAVWAIADVAYLVQAARGTYEEYTLLDTLWPLCALLLGLAAGRPAGRLHTGQPAPRHAVRARSRDVAGARGARGRPLRGGELRRAVAGDAGDRCGGRAVRAHLPREPAHARRERGGSGDGFADGARQPAGAAGGPPAAGGVGDARASGAARAVRPRRVQGLQRHVRPPGR